MIMMSIILIIVVLGGVMRNKNRDRDRDRDKDNLMCMTKILYLQIPSHIMKRDQKKWAVEDAQYWASGVWEDCKIKVETLDLEIHGCRYRASLEKWVVKEKYDSYIRDGYITI